MFGKYANMQTCASRLLPLILRLTIWGSKALDGADKSRYFLMADELTMLPRCREENN